MKIRVLPEHISNKIAAGEVVQRPESVVKELIENSLDAGASSIELIIKKAGKNLIRVVDDGEGMSEEDAVTSTLKHATSKIKSEDDLDSISTLGFRGEALSSIVAVSQFEMKTGTDANDLGTVIRVEDSNTIVREKGPFIKGTDISVKNLFYNIPARRNFLKTDATELKHVTETFVRLALSRSDVSFRLYVDDSLVYNLEKGNLLDRLIGISGDEIINNVIPVNQENQSIKLFGYIGKPVLTKKVKGEQYVFLNNRYVQSKQVNHAVFKAYENVLEKGDYPFFVLFIDIDPRRTDVNIHPSKLEVRFDDEKEIYDFIVLSARKSLSHYDLVPALSFSESSISGTEKLAFNNYPTLEKNDFSDRPSSVVKNGYESYSERPKPKSRYTDDEIEQLFSSLGKNFVRPAEDEDVELPFGGNRPAQQLPAIAQVIPSEPSETDSSAFMVQLHNRYILSQIKSGLMIVDQHVAHERILYEQAKKRIEQNLPTFQPLLFPKEVTTDPGTVALLKEIYDYIQRVGFQVKFTSKNSFLIEAVPEEVRVGEEEKILLEILDEYRMNQEEKHLEAVDNACKSFSCKAAIKSGDRLSDKEMRKLIDDLFATSMPYVCPHGRPVVIKISLNEFDKRFGRT